MSTEQTSKDFAVIATGGKQYVARPGKTITVETLKKSEGAVTFDEVLLQVKNGAATVGMPHVAGAAVHGTILGTGKGKKILVVKYKNKTRQKTSTGHRQTRTTVKIESI